MSERRKMSIDICGLKFEIAIDDPHEHFYMTVDGRSSHNGTHLLRKSEWEALGKFINAVSKRVEEKSKVC